MIYLDQPEDGPTELRASCECTYSHVSPASLELCQTRSLWVYPSPPAGPSQAASGDFTEVQVATIELGGSNPLVDFKFKSKGRST